MMKKVLITMMSVALASAAFAGTNGSNDEFKAGGKPLATIFTDFKYSTYDGKSNAAFEISRAYLGYSYDFSRDFSGKVVFDITSSNSGSYPSAYSVYVKNAFAEYSHNIFKLDFGMIGTSTFNFQEKMWGKRYLMKSFMDQNGYGSSADLGVGATVKLLPQLNLDAQILNGEGYQKVQGDSVVKVALGLTFEPVKNLFVRVYGDYMKKDNAQSTLAAFAGYKDDKLTLAGEFNYQKNNKMAKDHNLTGLSFWGNYNFTKSIAAFARFDNLSSNKIDGAVNEWNIAKDGQVYIAGVEFNPVKGILVSPNVQISNPKADGAKSTTNIMVNCSYNF
jgi:hypothetical protein